ncbi:unnamed protein product, partial [marine sediment metagenome]
MRVKYLIPVIALILIFSFALACVDDAEKGIEEELKKEETGVEKAEATVESVKSKGEYISLGESVEYNGLNVTVIDCEASYFYESDYETEYPEEGAKFIWICVKAENTGEQEKSLPGYCDFYILHIDTLIGSEVHGVWETQWGVDREIYEGGSVFPGVCHEGWILYEVPKDVKADDILVALECNYDKYYYWEISEPLKEAKSEIKTIEEEQVKDILL